MLPNPSMRIRLWGTRGGIASPLTSAQLIEKQVKLIQEFGLKGGFDGLFEGNKNPSEKAVRRWLADSNVDRSIIGTYGGNTTCVEVQVKDSPLIVLDAGTGIRLLGDELLQRYKNIGKLNPLSSREEDQQALHLLVSHVHYDHTQGLPFFAPGYFLAPNADLELHLWGRDYGNKTIEKLLREQQTTPKFPVDFRAQVESVHTTNHSIDEHDEKIGVANIIALPISHSEEIVTGYQITDFGGRRFAFITDVENGDKLSNNALQLIDSANVVYWDTQYTPEEYAGTLGNSKIGWGHDTYISAIHHALIAGVETLLLGHHDPKRSDDDLERQILEPARRYAKTLQGGENLKIDLAYEGQVIEF
jgi:phosphoribosyl 1,2-cyclic phosphodiesterase